MRCCEVLMKKYSFFQMNIKQEKQSDTKHTFIPRPIKAEPESDLEGKSRSKKRAANGTDIRPKKLKLERKSSSSSDDSKSP